MAEINTDYLLNGWLADKVGQGRNYVNEHILNDDSIRRIITANIDKIKEYEAKRGSKYVSVLNEYLNNKYSVFKSYNKKGKYISASQILIYLAYLGYKVEFAVSEID